MKRLHRLRSLFCVLLLAALASGCGQTPSPNLAYHRVPLSVEQVFTAPEVFTIDNCNASVSQERWEERTLTVGETVIFDEEDLQGVAVSLGFSYYVEAVVQLQSEVSNRYGAGLTAGQSKTQGVRIYVGPHQTAVVKLQWVETWENGYFEIFRDGISVGKVHYRLLADLGLDSSVATYDCSLLGRIKQAVAFHVTRAGIFAQSAWAWISSQWEVARDKWPWGRLEWWLLGVALLATGVILFQRRRRHSLGRHWR